MSFNDTTPSTVPADVVVEGSSDLETQPPRRRWPWVLGGIVVTLAGMAIVFAAIVDASTIGKDLYILSPGSATNTAESVNVQGAETYAPEGEIAFTTVSIRRDISVWEWLIARYDDSSELVPAELIDGTRSTEEAREVTRFQMSVSQDTATLVALDFLGYDIVPEVEGAFVLQLVPESPAEAQLRLGDLITEVNGAPIRSSDDLGDAIRAAEPGDIVAITLSRGDVADGGDGSDPDAETVELEVELADHPDVEGAGFLGVRIETPIRADAPFDVSIDVGRVRGPSAGLAFSLAIVDVLSEGELTGGARVATTGTISANGIIGAVGGVPQKIAAAEREGIDVFLVPPSEYNDAISVAGGDIEIRCVQTFDDAVITLAEFGGNGIAVAEQFGAPPPEQSPNPIDPNDGFETCAEVVGAS